MSMKYYLIHGYGRALNFSEKEVPANMGFYIFDEELKSGQAKVFDWAIRVKRNFWSLYNPVTQIRLYYKEKKKAEYKSLQSQLWQNLQKDNPEIVICHSLGCQLFLNTIKNFGSLESIKKVIFVFADLPNNQKLENLKTELINFYCYWDNALLASSLLNLYLPLGLLGAKDTEVKNVFYKLTKGPNLHQQIWRDNNFKMNLLKNISNNLN